jgi:hypothetical protein
LEARREEEERRRNKYAKMEADREKVRQGIREKVMILNKKIFLNKIDAISSHQKLAYFFSSTKSRKKKSQLHNYRCLKTR